MKICPAAVALAIVLALLPASAARAETDLTCEKLPELMQKLFNHHIRNRHLSEEIRGRVIDSYLRRIDPSSLLLKSEVQEIRASLDPVFGEIGRGECSRLATLQKRIVERVLQTETTVRAFVSAEDYAIDSSVELVLDPKRRGHPETEEARQDLIQRLVHFQMSNYLDADTELSEAKQKLVHRYELATMRANEHEGEDVFAVFLDAFASSLDPHTSYFSRDAWQDFRIGVSLSLEGIGVALTSQDGYSVVMKIIPGGAADRAKALEVSDKIIAVRQSDAEFVDIIDMALRDVVRLIRGKRGTPVTLKVLRQDETTHRFDVTIVRDKIDLVEAAADLRFEERQVGGQTFKLAVIDLPSFYGDKDPTQRQCSRDVARLLKRVKAEKADGLVLDLSRNGGGILDFAVLIAGFFLKAGPVVAVGDLRRQPQVMNDPDHGVLYQGPMVVLTSRLSASGSEIVAGALKDHRRALIVGDDHTFGKGTVQSILPLEEGLGALKVTTALFFRPGGNSTQNTGVAADIVVPTAYATKSVGEDSQAYSLEGQTIDPFLKLASTKATWPTVSQEVIRLLAKRSRTRVEASEDFSKIREQLAEAEENGSRVRLDEIQRRREESRDEESGDEESGDEEKEEELTPQMEEALDVLADYAAWILMPSTLTAQTDTQPVDPALIQ